MGYTHYWTFDGDPETYGRTALDARLIVDHAESIGVAIRGWDGTGEPEISERAVSLNGDAETDGDYESFTLSGQATEYDFCKTSGTRPYDAVVTAILIRLAQHGGPGGHATVRSDGTWAEWDAGRAIVAAVFYDAPETSILSDR